MKRVRPAPMGRAFRVVKRTTHLTVKVAERPLKISAVGTGPEGGRGARPAKKAAPSARAKKAGV
jgi:large subunit ribosomal protein L22